MISVVLKQGEGGIRIEQVLIREKVSRIYDTGCRCRVEEMEKIMTRNCHLSL